ncbi:Choline/Carnitine o-acyltransferase-domain-containing protein [Diplogelasinospora grovesii]|uniref:Choline/Carnitine o-acyltransferase-domain-containing protein n=1 Tax=Diplogelasinospora grovesii TaxID=303347 RepID=A0AAN6N5Y1_9PEZI|nr:Choline/Carnitine o-acyltransferase-domain-containing protein [Diplogelasinospora grovesii]
MVDCDPSPYMSRTPCLRDSRRTGRLSLACINSPGSTTLSGDRDAIEELKTVLECDSVMAKMLAVDVAYHSHHMRAVADHYLNSLHGLETSAPRDNVQFFSSVTGGLKTSGFGPEYWVQNLVSTVDHKYVSALVRGKNAYTTGVALAGKLFEFGLDVNVEAVNAMNGGAKVRDMILDLPPYAWDYSNRYWHESRLSKEYRFRKYPYHDLLGLRLIGSTPLEPIWRNILSIDAQPWLNEHIIDGFAILPGSSFLTMAMEAARQLNEERGAPRIRRFHLKKVDYSKAIMILDSPGKVEVMISLSAPGSCGATPRESSEWESFKITSSHDAKTWALYCRGYIRLEYGSAPNEVDAGREEQQALSDLRKRLSQTDSACTQSIDHDSLYGEMRQNGRSGDATSIGECAGVITALGSDLAHSFQIGDRVCCWNTNVAFASQTRVKGSFVQRIPESWSVETGAALPQNVSLAYYGLRDCAQVESGQTVLVHGASGPLVQAVALVANLLGLQVVATVRAGAEKQALASFRGTKPAHMLYSDDSALPKALLRLTRGAGVDAVFNTSSTPLSEELMTCVAPFGTVVDMHGYSSSSAVADRAVKYVSFDAAQLLRHRPSAASTAFKTALALLPDENLDDLFPVTAVHIADVASAFKAVQGQAHVGKMVLLADEDAMVNVKENVAPTNALADVERIIQAVTDLSIPQEQKNALLALIAQSSAAGSDASLATATNGASSSASHDREDGLARLVTISAEQLDPHEPLVDLGLDSLIAIEFKSWLGRALGADVRVHDILDAAGLEALAALVAQKSTFVPSGLPEESTRIRANGADAVTQPTPSKTTESAANGTAPSNGAVIREYRFVPNRLPNFPLPDINALCDAFLTGVKAFTTPSEFANTIRAVEEFKRPGSAGRLIYDRAAARAADPNVENWEWELQLQRGFLDPSSSAIRSANNNTRKQNEPLSSHTHWRQDSSSLWCLNEQELTTAFHQWIFNTVRVPGVGSDKMQRHPNNDYCVVFWKGHAFKLSLSVGNEPATYEELFAAFELILSQSVARSFVTIFTSDNRHPWAETRQRLQQLDPQNAASIATTEAAAFTVSLDEATPTTGTERGRQFHFGGENDAANRWHDKSLQFAVCSNGVSGTISEHTMLDALTLSELNDAIATTISSHAQTDVRALPTTTAITPVSLPLKTDATLEAHIDKVRAQYADSIKDAEHAYLLFQGYGSKLLRAQKLSPKSVFQMVVQLAAYSTFGYTPPCWETVNQAHYHLGRVDIIQVVNPQVAAFLTAARDPSVDMSQRRALLIDAIRAHERNMTALRALLEKGEEVPVLYEDPVYKRVRPRVMMSNCFETGMLEKGCMWKAPEAVWSHYEVYDESTLPTSNLTTWYQAQLSEKSSACWTKPVPVAELANKAVHGHVFRLQSDGTFVPYELQEGEVDAKAASTGPEFF